MTKILVVTDTAWVRNQLHATLTASGFDLIDHSNPNTIVEVAVEKEVDVVIADLQIGAMGGMAVARFVREATGSADSPGLPVVLMLDRRADTFLAKRAGAAAWLTKPFTSSQIEAVLDEAMASRVPAPGVEGGAT